MTPVQMGCLGRRRGAGSAGCSLGPVRGGRHSSAAFPSTPPATTVIVRLMFWAMVVKRTCAAALARPHLIGWRGYCGFCQIPRVFTQPLQGTEPSWRSKVQCRGHRRFADGILACVRTPGGPTGPAQPLLRATRSLPSLCLCPSVTGRTAVVRDPYARWCGRGAP